MLKLVLVLAALSASSNALRLRCDFRNAQWTFGNGYTCYGSVVDNANTEILDIVNPESHLPDMTNDNVTGLFIRNENVNELPLNMGWRLRNLRGFECDTCNITRLRSSQLERCTNLEHFAIPRNRVRQLPGNFFRFTVNLQWVYLHNNQIANAGLNVLKNLRKLRGIYMANNGCISDNAVMDSRRVFMMMHGLIKSCTPELDDFVRESEDTECTFTEDTSNENPPKSSSSTKTKETFSDELWGFMKQ